MADFRLTNRSNQAVQTAALRRIGVGLALNLCIVVVQVWAGLAANSLAILTDAAHNLTDVLALALSFVALRLSLRPASDTRTFGYHRAGILAALINTAALMAITAILLYEAIARLSEPTAVRSSLLIGIGFLGLIVNLGTAWALHSHSRNDLNIRSSFLHMLGDALASLGVLAAGVGIAITRWDWLDPAAAVLIAVLILWQTLGLGREVLNILLEATPHGLDLNELVNDLLCVQGVRGVHDLHVWSISQNLRALSAHILTEDITISQGALIQHNVNDLLLSKYSIAHSALQLECSGCNPDPLYCDLTTWPHSSSQALPKQRS